MKKEKNVGRLLGIQQEEMAKLLEVTRGNWSMYVTGRRKLPKAAQIKVNAMVAFAKKLNTPDQIGPYLSRQEQQAQEWFENKRSNNLEMQSIIAAKLKRCKEKFEAAFIAFHLVDFLADRPNYSAKSKEVLPGIKKKAAAALEKNGLALQEQYTFQLLLLEQEELLLAKYILQHSYLSGLE